MRALPESGVAGSGAARWGAFGLWGYPWMLGGFLGVVLLKCGNPVILDALVQRPSGLAEWLWNAWPLRYGYVLLIVVSLAGLPWVRWPRAVPRFWVILPGVWLAWQGVSLLTSIDPIRSRDVGVYLGACVVCFYLGLMVPTGQVPSRGFWGLLLLGFIWVLFLGMEQHYGGLEATRRMVYEQPGWQSLPPEYLRRLESNRVFSALFYPNSFAQVILLLAPPVLAAVWCLVPDRLRLLKLSLLGSVVYGSAACLIWSGSKAGWLVAVVVLAVGAWHLPMAGRVRLWGLVGLVVVGVALFGIRYWGYFGRGATSVVARGDYWRAAIQLVLEKPLLGTGPGTFGACYQRLKRPESEMSRMVHNDYLQQAAESGLVAFVLFLAMVGGGLAVLYRQSTIEPLRFGVWLGVLGASLHSIVEFGFYVPAVAWLLFYLMGWLWQECHRSVTGASCQTPHGRGPGTGQPAVCGTGADNRLDRLARAP